MNFEATRSFKIFQNLGKLRFESFQTIKTDVKKSFTVSQIVN